MDPIRSSTELYAHALAMEAEAADHPHARVQMKKGARNLFLAGLLVSHVSPVFADHLSHLVAHISGGVGLEERETLLARRGKFNYALLSPRRYTLAATFQGQTQRRELVVPAKGSVDLASCEKGSWHLFLN